VVIRRKVNITSGTAGWLGVLGVVVTADLIAARRGQPTMSGVVATCGDHPVLGPVTFGIAAGLWWHLFAWPILDKLGVEG
jgi:hypothetical protein